MVTKTSGGKITGLLALTMEAQAALSIGDLVHVTGDYEVGMADNTKPVIGHVSVSNKRGITSTATSVTYNDPVVPGAVTVEARGFYVQQFVANGAVAAGSAVVAVATATPESRVRQYDPTAAPGAADTPDDQIGVALTGAAAAGDVIDVLVR